MIFFLVICLLILFLYAIGTIQGFIDSTQLFLLRLYVVSGIFLTLVSVYGTVLSVGRCVKSGKKRYLFRALGYLFLVFFGAMTVLAIMFIISLLRGNGT